MRQTRAPRNAACVAAKSQETVDQTTMVLPLLVVLIIGASSSPLSLSLLVNSCASGMRCP